MRLYYYTAKQWGIKSLWEGRLKVARYEDLNDPFELYPFNRQKKNERELWNLIVREMKTHGVLCFSESWQSVLMWAHYGDKHAGMVLGFDVADAMAEPVSYVPEVLPSPIAGAADAKSGDWLTHAVLNTAVNTKFDGWAYERERRLRVKLETAVDGIYYRPFDDLLALREVIIGARCSLSQDDVRDAVDENPWYDVEITKARASFGEFEICRDQRYSPVIVKGMGDAGRKQRALVRALREHNRPRPADAAQLPR